MLLWGRLQGLPAETWDYSPPLTILSSSPDRRTKAPSSPLTGHQYLHHKALPFQSSLSGSQQWQHEPSIPQILLGKTKLDTALVSGLREGVLTPSPFHVKIRELPLLPLCSSLCPSSNSSRMPPTFPSPAWSSPPLPPQGTPIDTDYGIVYTDLSLLNSFCHASARGYTLWESLTAPT